MLCRLENARVGVLDRKIDRFLIFYPPSLPRLQSVKMTKIGK